MIEDTHQTMTRSREFLNADRLQYVYPFRFRKYGLKLLETVQTPPRLPNARVEHGIAVKDGERLKLVFETVNSDWIQGVQLEIDKGLIISDKFVRRGTLVFYESPDHREMPFICRTKEGILWIWNIWNSRPNGPGRALEGRIFYSGMIVDEIPNGYRYHCNEGRNDDDYDDLVFRIERSVDVTD